VVAILKAVAFFDIVACLATPVTGLAIVCPPSMNGLITNGNSGHVSLSSSEIGGRVVVVVDIVTDAGDCISSSQAIRATIHGKMFGLKGLLEGSNRQAI